MNILKSFFSGRFGIGSAPAKAAAGKARVKKSFKTTLEEDFGSKLAPGQIKQLKHGDFEEGLVASLTGKELLLQHSDKIKKLTSGIGLPRDQFQLLIYPVIERFADFAHNLPASKAHHHRGYGGLLAHSLDVACYAVNTAVLTSFDYGSNPSMRTIRRERWYAAATFAALLHDAGKALNDMEVHDENREHTWDGTKPIFEWAETCGIKSYLVTWVPNRGEKHKIISPSLLERFIPDKTRAWIREGGIDIYHAMVDAMACNDPKAVLTGIVIKSDSASVDLNLKTGQGLGSGGGDLAVNVPSNFTNAAQYLLEKGIWTANTNGSRIWTTTIGVFIAWKTAVPEVVNFFDTHKIRGCPRGSDSLGSVLIDHGMLEPSEDGGLYWNVAPDILTNSDTGKRLWLKCVKLASSQTLYPYDPAPDAVAVSIGGEESSVRYDPGAGEYALGEDSDGDQGETPASNVDFMSPMFSLDAPAAKPAASKPALEFVTPTSDSPAPAVAISIGGGGASKAPSSASNNQAKQNASTQNHSGRKTPGKPNVGKSPSELGITLDVAANTGTPALVIRGASEPLPSALPIADKKVAVSAPDTALGKKKPKPLQVQPSIQVAAPSVVEQPVADFDIDDFGPISGVDDNLEPEKATLTPPSDTEVDPFSEPDVSGVADPFNTVKPLAKPQAKVNQESPQATIAQVEDSAIHPIENAGSDLELHTPADQLGLEDFDPEIMKMMGLEVPVRSQAVDSAPMIQVPVASPRVSTPDVVGEIKVVARTAIPDAFRLDSVSSDFSVEIPEMPNTNPSDFKSVPDELRFNDAQAPVRPLIEASTKPESSFQIAGDDDLSDFDLPSFVGDFFKGDVPQILGASIPKKSAPESSGSAQVSSAVIENKSVEQSSNETKKTRSEPASKIGASIPPAVVIKAAPQVQASVLSSSPSSAPIIIGSAMHQVRRERKAAQVEGPSDAKSSLKVFTAKDVAEFEAFLGRTPGLRTKLLHHSKQELSGIYLDAKRPFVPFCQKPDEGGFVESDITSLAAAGWVWHNFTNPQDPLVGRCRFAYGFFLTPYLGECVSYLSGGVCALDFAKEHKTAFGYAELGHLAEKVIASNPPKTPIEGGVIYRFTPKRRIKLALDLGVKQSDIERAILEHTNYLATEKYWQVLVENQDVNDE